MRLTKKTRLRFIALTSNYEGKNENGGKATRLGLTNGVHIGGGNTLDLKTIMLYM